MQLNKLNFSEAKTIYDQLPLEKKIATLSPEYVKLDAAREIGCEPLYLGYKEQNELGIYSSIIKKIATKDESYVVQNPYGYGAEITSSCDSYFKFRAKIDCWFKLNNVMAETVSYHPLLSHNDCDPNPKPKIFRSLQKKCVAINYNDPKWNEYTSRCRNSIRKGINFNYKCEILDSHKYLDIFISLYYRVMKKIGASPFYFFERSYFDNLISLDNCKLMVCKKNDEWHSAAFFLETELYAEYHLAATSSEGRNNGATNVLLDYAAKYFATKNINIFYLGGGVTSKRDDPLLKFKSSFSNHYLNYYREFRLHDHRFINEKIYKHLPIFDSLDLIIDTKN